MVVYKENKRSFKESSITLEEILTDNNLSEFRGYIYSDKITDFTIREDINVWKAGFEGGSGKPVDHIMFMTKKRHFVITKKFKISMPKPGTLNFLDQQRGISITLY